MALRPCLDCREPTANARCPTCTRAKDKARGTRQQRGYDAKHQAQRNQWAPRVALGLVPCWRCNTLIRSGGPWDLGHDDTNRAQYRGPEHVKCNRATSGRSYHP